MKIEGPPEMQVNWNQSQAGAGSHNPILVTGANGFIGSWVVRTLLAHGYQNQVLGARDRRFSKPG